MQAAGRKVRQRASVVYDAAVGTAGGKEIVDDKSYRDKGGKRMADERFQKCMMTWYFSIRRVDTKHLVDDLTKLEFSLAELAYVDMEVRRSNVQLPPCLTVCHDLAVVAQEWVL